MSNEAEDQPMEKNGRVEIGKTPSIVSGKPSEMIKNGEAVTSDEEIEEIQTDFAEKLLGELDS